MKSVMLIASLMALAVSAVPLAGPKATVMENEALLDPRGQMIIRWTIVAGGSGIEIELVANCTGWMGIAFDNGGAPFVPGTYADIILSGYDDVNKVGYVEDRVIDLGVPVPSNGGELDHFWQDVTVLDASYSAPWTTVRLLRKINTGDSEDIAIVPGPMSVGWTFADSDDTEVAHDIVNSGFGAQVTFIPKP